MVENKKNNWVIFIIGPTASGKTTIGEILFDRLSAENKNLIFYDGDEIRKKLKYNYGHSISDRYKVLNEYLDIINEDVFNNKKVIISTVLHKQDMRVLVKEQIKNCFIIYLKCSLDNLAKRDYKSRYSDAKAGKLKCFPGVTEPYEDVLNADIIINTENNSIDSCVAKIQNRLKEIL
jgi:adenylylsulfate kinase-like enzyme